jgi:nitrogen fixation protein FixH
MSIIKSGRLWPYGIAIAITMVFGFCVATVMVTSKADVQESDAYMTNYQNADAKANDFIKERIAFDKKYRLKYVTEKLDENGCDVKYSLTTRDGKPVKNAEMVLAISRPDTHSYDKTIKNPIFVDGVYVFKDVKFPKTGVWNLLLKVQSGDNSRFYSIKTDTRINHDRSIEEAHNY